MKVLTNISEILSSAFKGAVKQATEKWFCLVQKVAGESSACYRAKQCSIKGLRKWFSTIKSFFTVLNTLGRLFKRSLT